MLKHNRLLLLIFFLLGLLAIFELTGLRQHFSLAYLREILHMHPVLGLCFFVGAFCVGNLVQIPGWIFLASAVLALGQLYGGIVTYIAAMSSCAITFLIVRLIGGDALRKLDSKFARSIFAKLEQYPVASIAMLRTLMQTAPALNYALGLSGVSFKQYMVGTAIGLPLPILLYCVFFEHVAKILNIS